MLEYPYTSWRRVSRVAWLVGVFWMALSGRSADAADDPAVPTPRADRYDFSVRSETYAELFRRAMLPGPNGSLVETQTALPVNQYIFLGAHDLDTSWKKDSLDVELAAYGRAWFGEEGNERRLDGDIQTAHVGYRHGLLSVKVGRQHAAGGAARYVRFDGASVDVALGKTGLDAEFYGGFTALPRWNQLPGYHHLGSASDSLLRDPEALPQPDRSGNFLVGGRVGYSSEKLKAGVSIHEQHEDLGLSRRTFGFDGRAFLIKYTTVGTNGLIDLDAQRVQDARVWFDVSPMRQLDFSLEFLHTEPALFLSRQSVLSVFSTNAYEEAGGTANYRFTNRIAADAGTWVQFYDEAHRGARGEVAVRVLPSLGKKTSIRLGYTRVRATDNGYHSARLSIVHRIITPLTATAEAYLYLYDEAIRDTSSSTVYAGTVGYQATERLHLLCSGSIAQSPYAAFDAQTMLRAVFSFDVPKASVMR